MTLFGETLQTYRLRAGLSQNALAHKCALNSSYINRLESGEREYPSEQAALAIADALHLSISDTTVLLLRASIAPAWLREMDEMVGLVALMGKVMDHPQMRLHDSGQLVGVMTAIVRMWDEGLASRSQRNKRPVLVATGG